MSMAEPIQKRKISREVVDRLMQRSRSGEIKPGDQLPPERELMDFYGVGRPAIREALQALQRDGIVEISHGERARVIVPTARDLIQQMLSGTRHLLQVQPDALEHLKQLRVFLEVGTARMAAEKATADDVALIRQRIAAQREALPRSDEFLLHDMAFHKEIARISGNPIFPAVVEAIFLWASDYYQPMVRAPGAEQLTLQEHERLADAIEAHDGEAAAAAVRDHLLRSNELYRTVQTPPV